MEDRHAKSALPWSPPNVVAIGQSPGSPLEIGNSVFGPMLSTISSGGNWNVWIYEPLGVWTNQLVGSGFFLGAPIACAPAVGTVFTIDPLGRLVCANWTGSAWSTGYAMPLLAYTPQLVSLGVIPIAPGELLGDGEQLDLVQIARRLNNPGAVIHFAKPLNQP